MIGGTPDFSALKIGPVDVGNFINAVIAFLLKAAGLYFLIIVPFNRFAKKLAAARPAPVALRDLPEGDPRLARRSGSRSTTRASELAALGRR